MIAYFKLCRFAVAAAAVVALTPGSGRAGVIYDTETSPTLIATSTTGQAEGIQTDTVTPGAVYSDATTFSGYAIYAGTNGTTKYTALLADDITTTAAAPFTLGEFSWSIANGATVAQTISPYIRFYDTSGAGGGPGVLLGGLNFNGISVPAGNVSGFFYNATTSAITLPTSFWACEFFSTTGTAANAAKIGEGTFNPVDVGSSADEDFTSTSVSTGSSSFTSADPAGTVNVSPFAGAPVANFEWEFNPAATATAPEPSSLVGCVFTAGTVLWLVHRRRAV